MFKKSDTIVKSMRVNLIIRDMYGMEYISSVKLSCKSETQTADLNVSSSWAGYVNMRLLMQPQFVKAEGNLCWK
jgi:hypothetical protein